jgi:DNA-binding NtrC family response regulator
MIQGGRKETAKGLAGMPVLRVDNYTFLTDAFQFILEDAEFCVETAAMGAQALGKAETMQFRLVLTDLRLPGIQGGRAKPLPQGDDTRRQLNTNHRAESYTEPRRREGTRQGAQEAHRPPREHQGVEQPLNKHVATTRRASGAYPRASSLARRRVSCRRAYRP